jgi:NADH:ubiquinone oxidoreductase subunit E
MEMDKKHTLYLCMGSACHQLGGYRLIPVLESLIKRHHLENCLELKGAFCLDACEHGRSLKFGDRVFTGLTADNIEEKFAREILPRLNPEQHGQ